MKKNLRRQRGYSLVELLTVVSVFGVLAITSTNLFFSSVVGSSKEASIRDVKQSGDFAVVQLENVLRNAKRATCVDSKTLSLINAEDETVLIGLGEGESSSKLLINSSELLSNKTEVTPGGLEVNCQQDPNTGVTTVSVMFELKKSVSADDKPEDTYQEKFNATVTLRNRF